MKWHKSEKGPKVPEYTYRCENCNETLTTIQSIKEKPKKKCPLCHKHKLERVLLNVNFVIKDKEAKTVGELAARNTDKMGKLDFQAREHDRINRKDEAGKILGKEKDPTQLSKKRPWWRPHSDKPLDLKKVKNVDKYIRTGNKD